MIINFNVCDIEDLLNYLYMHRNEFSCSERATYKFFRDLGLEPIEVPGKIITLRKNNPGFRLGVFKVIDGKFKESNQEAKYSIMSPGWRFNGEQVLPVEVAEVLN